MVSLKNILLFILTGLYSFGIVTSQILSEKIYVKEFYADGTPKAEGWLSGKNKTGYWYFYHTNGKIAEKGHFHTQKKEGYWYFYHPDGTLEKEGHFKNGFAEHWWVYYPKNSKNKDLFQYQNNKRNGYGLRYKRNKLMKVEKYKDDKKIGEWTSLVSFKMDNPNLSIK